MDEKQVRVSFFDIGSATLNDENVWESDSKELAELLNMVSKQADYSPAFGDKRIYLAEHVAQEVPGIEILELPDPDPIDPNVVY